MPQTHEHRFAVPDEEPTRAIQLRDGRRYRLIRRIAQSAQSAVWRARDNVTGRDVVVKRLAGAAVDDPIARRRLDDEAAAAAQVRHPNTLPVLDTIRTDEEVALVFPYVEGETLAQRLTSESPLRPAVAARIALDVADALAAAHAAGVVHRDVKPSNILLEQGGSARLIDFGIARVGDIRVGHDADRLELTGSGTAIGTLRYMAPEQLTGASPTPAADVFSLGVVLYEMLAGRRPFAGHSPQEQLALHQVPAPALSAPPALRDIVAGALDVRPETRLGATQIARGLRAWLDSPSEVDEPTELVATAPVPAAVAVPIAAAPRRRLAAGLAAVAACVIAVAVGATALPWFAAPTTQPNDDVAALVTPAPTEARPPADVRADVQPDAQADAAVAPQAPERTVRQPAAQPDLPAADDGPPGHVRGDEADKPKKKDKPGKTDKPGKGDKPKRPKKPK